MVGISFTTSGRYSFHRNSLKVFLSIDNKLDGIEADWIVVVEGGTDVEDCVCNMVINLINACIFVINCEDDNILEDELGVEVEDEVEDDKFGIRNTDNVANFFNNFSFTIGILTFEKVVVNFLPVSLPLFVVLEEEDIEELFTVVVDDDDDNDNSVLVELLEDILYISAILHDGSLGIYIETK